MPLPESRPRPAALLDRLRRRDRGVISVHNLFLTIAFCAIGAAGVDVTHLYAARSQLQATADLAAHAALYERRFGLHENRGEGMHYYPIASDTAEDRAIALAEVGLAADFGDVITRDDILIGRYDYASDLVYQDPDEPASSEAAVVFTNREDTNPVGTFLWRLVGVDSVDVRAASVFVLGPGECDDDQGLFSMTAVRIRSGNTFHPGFCIGAPEFEAQNGNEFRPGVTTMIPTIDDLLLSNSDVDEHNPGLMESLQFDTLDLSATMNLINTSNTSLQNNFTPASPHFNNHAYTWSLMAPGGRWATNTGASRTSTPIQRIISATGSGARIDPTQLTANRVHWLRCDEINNQSQKKVRLVASGSNVTFRNVVIVTDCMVEIDGGILMSNAVVSSSFTSNNRNAISLASSHVGPTFGVNDGCAAGGGVALITRGNFNAASKPNFYGAILRVAGSVDFQSGSNAEGVSIMANAIIDTQSEHVMRPCGPASGASSTNVSLRMIQ